MPTVRVATFNVENLFARWKFNADIDPVEASTRGWIVDDTKFQELGVDEKAITGAAVRQLDADVIALQEVEGVDTLKRFRNTHLRGRQRPRGDNPGGYPFVAGIDGNDPRLIDVAVLSRLPIVHIRSYQHDDDPATATSLLFSRDCLEVTLDVGGGQQLTLFVNHFKSMMGGRAQTRPKRERQAARVKDIVTERFGDQPGDHPWIVLGDLNDYPESDDQGETALSELVGWDQLENVIDRLPAAERWTHFWSKKRHYKQLDYILLSRSLAQATQSPPEIMRMGMPLRADRYTGPRFDGVGENHPKASDHCAVLVDVAVGS